MKTELALSCPRCMKVNVVEMNKFAPEKFTVLNDLVANCEIEENGDYGFLGTAKCECGKVICAALTVSVLSQETVEVVFSKNSEKM